MQTKAYIALITKWYVTEVFSAALPTAEAPEFEFDVIYVIAKNFFYEESPGT